MDSGIDNSTPVADRQNERDFIPDEVWSRNKSLGIRPHVIDLEMEAATVIF